MLYVLDNPAGVFVHPPDDDAPFAVLDSFGIRCGMRDTPSACRPAAPRKTLLTTCLETTSREWTDWIDWTRQVLSGCTGP